MFKKLRRGIFRKDTNEITIPIAFVVMEITFIFLNSKGLSDGKIF